LKDAIQNGQNGFSIETEDTQGYVKKINELLADDAYRKEFGQRASRYVAENFAWDKIAKRYLEVIKRTTDSH